MSNVHLMHAQRPPQHANEAVKKEVCINPRNTRTSSANRTQLINIHRIIDIQSFLLNAHLLQRHSSVCYYLSLLGGCKQLVFYNIPSDLLLRGLEFCRGLHFGTCFYKFIQPQFFFLGCCQSCFKSFKTSCESLLL